MHKKKEGEQYRNLAIRLMQSNASKNQLDPMKVLDLIPGDWELQTAEYDLTSFLSSVFDHQMTREENSKIARHLSQMEQLNSDKEKNDLESAYLVIREDTDC